MIFHFYQQIQKYYKNVSHTFSLYMSIVTGWGCACCLRTVVGKGWYHKDCLNPLPGPSPGLLYVDTVVLGLLLAIPVGDAV